MQDFFTPDFQLGRVVLFLELKWQLIKVTDEEFVGRSYHRLKSVLNSCPLHRRYIVTASESCGVLEALPPDHGSNTPFELPALAGLVNGR